MIDERFRFVCNDVADCDVIITSTVRESVIEAARSHLRDVHGREVLDADVEPYIEEL